MEKKFRVAVLLDASRAYDRDVLRGITHFNKLYDRFNFFFYSPKYIHADDNTKLIERLWDWKPEGIVTREIPSLETMRSWNIPMIVSPHTRLYKDCVNLWADNTGIGELAAEYFLNKGYKNLGLLGFKKFVWSLERENGFQLSAGKRHVRVEKFLFDDHRMLWEDLPLRLLSWLKTIPKPCAIFSVTDELNVHLLDAAKVADYKVPDELAILGVDNDELLCDMALPTLSSIDQNAWRAGYEIAQGMLQWIETQKRPQQDFMIKPNVVIERHSTSALAIEDEQVRKALNYINVNAPYRDIHVNDVVHATNHSRRILEKKFSLLLNSSILEEIKKVRIKRIKNFLAESDLTAQQIAYEMGFGNPDNITRYFKMATGFKPLEYRKEFQPKKSL
ncbi:XylR family transcriptional regulator [Chryseolinea soli]|uniref:XylR family transcriptional regulator n=1 Tax=Chryseolinea soli TaxID=2321403 RepID=UPI001358C0CC|nr:DNA-binding transcriptional regulator [Chryseolinea soli]